MKIILLIFIHLINATTYKEISNNNGMVAIKTKTYCSATTGINGGQAMVLVKTPVLDDKDFDLLELHTLKVNNSRIKTDINLVAKHGNLIYAQTTKCDICEGTKLIEDECIHNILTHQTPKCTL
ncbi:uncharacterized protein LOC134217412 [Armigeres subalbatus]|uniref:uncharacterized protein LOC134217412 n=1 Tax=Armigeres subalbatus TaxID=124917 RepID=UPI002ED1D2F5